ncbi:MAG: bifunctional (p)ppGpp synthetase/guanosine-3',5'-bis(diphosphate) 3'-pyrophosphohydrolase, partial [Bacteroidetes bacterium]|nr:bifunctional (p)ppGpp synthetase/guanosine-3',5'-bis(diphosphate) 3'-pyrophosphohydrolase [Bacteroidota bacterium]
PDTDAFEFLDDFTLNLYGTEINVFTPKGDMISMPKNSTIIDFAYEIHTDIGNKCIGAKINLRLVPISHILHSGDQIEILTSENQTPKLEWLKFTTSAKARGKLKAAFKLEKSMHIEKGKTIVEDAIKNAKALLTSNNLKKIIGHFNLNNKDQLYSEVGMGFIELKDIDDILGKKSENKLVKYWNITFGSKKKENEFNEKNTNPIIDKKKTFLLKEDQDNISFSLAKCCNPIPGEQVIGYLSTDDHVIIHKTECHELAKYLSNRGERIVAAEWTKFKRQSYLTRLRLGGFDKLGMVNQVTTIISKEHNINMRSVKFDTHEGIFEADLFLYIHNSEDLTNLISRLKKVEGIENVSREENLND